MREEEIEETQPIQGKEQCICPVGSFKLVYGACFSRAMWE